MATIDTRKNKAGEITGYRLRACVGRDQVTYKQIWRTCTIPRPEGLTPKKEEKEVKRIADDWERKVKKEYELTQAKVDKKKISFEDFVNNHWMKDFVNDGGHKPTSIAYYTNMSRVIVAYFGKTGLNQIGPETVKRFIKYLRVEAVTARGKPYSDYSVQQIYGVFEIIMEYARRMRYIDNNPCKDLEQKEKPSRTKKPVDFLSTEEARRFLECLKNEDLFWRAYFTLLILTGLRRGEAVGLRWEDVDAEKMVLTVSRNVTPDSNSNDKYSVGTTKTEQVRKIPLSASVYRLLLELKAEREAKLQVKLLPTAYIFCRNTDPLKPIHPTAPTGKLRKIVEKYDLPNISPHDLRHTAASLTLEAGGTLKDAQQLLGHSNFIVTAQTYTGLTEKRQRDTVTKIDNLVITG